MSSVPKVTVAEHGQMSFCKHNVWPTGYIIDVSLELKSQFGELLLKRYFVPRVPTGVRFLNP
jgi:hypothetical protein